MKKILNFLLAAALICASAVSAQAKSKYTRSTVTLPVSAQTVLDRNFKADVSMVKTDKEFGRVKEYEVILTDGTEITFDRSGNWKSVETSAKKNVPDFFVPDLVKKYVKQYHKDARLCGIERSGRGYEVELSNGVEMHFDRDGKFIRYDD
ncbi:MAG: PepSY-like domain-containing protein [Muribaculaceae bacterium]|nr:PepSY-like domain-containing protein [Muribaculaceae bacterium]